MMKQVVLAICLLIGVQVFAQVQFGVKAGGNIATTKDLIAFPKNRVGWYGGLTMELPINRYFFFQSEMLFSSKGYKVDQQLGADKTSIRFNYINIPLLIGYRFEKNSSILLGTELGYLAGARLIMGKENNLYVGKHYPAKFDIAASIGLQHQFLKNLYVEVRYNYGFNMLYSVDAIGQRHSDSRGANRVFQVGLNYKLIKNTSHKN